MYIAISDFWSQRNLSGAVDYLELAARKFDLEPSCRRLSLVNIVGAILVVRNVGITPGIYVFNSQGRPCSEFDFESPSPSSAMLDGRMTPRGNSGGRVHSTVVGSGSTRQAVQTSGDMRISFGADGVKVEVSGADSKMLSQQGESVEVIVVLPEACEQFTLRNCHMHFANMANGLTVNYHDCTSLPLALPNVRQAKAAKAHDLQRAICKSCAFNIR